MIKNITYTLIICLSLTFSCRKATEVDNRILKVVNTDDEKMITILDTTINDKKININWLQEGLITLKINKSTDTIKWFPYDEFARDRNHASIIIPDHKKAEKVVVNDTLCLFSIVDFKGRGSLFYASIYNGIVKFPKPTPKSINPIIRECPYIFVDLKKNLIVNNGGNYQTDSEPYYSSIKIFEYKIDNNTLIEKQTRLIKKQYLIDNEINFYSANGAIKFYKNNY